MPSQKTFSTRSPVVKAVRFSRYDTGGAGASLMTSHPTNLSKPLAEVLALHADVVASARTTIEKAIRIGELLTEIKAGLKHGQWLAWIESRLPFSDHTARNYIRVYEQRERLKLETVSDLTDAYRLLSAGGSDTAHVSHNSGENEWYTPPEFIEAVNGVMGAIDCDPASTPAANNIVRAKKFFDKEQDGLNQKWAGRVFLNPPYAQPLISQFAEAVATKFKAGEIQEACVLVNNACETDWFTRIASVAAAICFPKGRVKFLDTDGNPGAPLQGQAMIYLGNQRESFCREFAGFGLCVHVIH
jgi:hypothetical protein